MDFPDQEDSEIGNYSDDDMMVDASESIPMDDVGSRERAGTSQDGNAATSIAAAHPESDRKERTQSQLTTAQLTTAQATKSSSSRREAGGGVVTARGTIDGLVLRLDGRVDHGQLKSALREFVQARKVFLGGNEVSLEWVGVEPEVSFIDELREDLDEQFNIQVKTSFLKEVRSKPLGEAIQPERIPQAGRAPSLFGGLEHASQPAASSASSAFDGDKPVRADSSSSAGLWDDPDARVVYMTLRSGQRIETEHSLIIVGEVNSGAELIAGGDIIVLGTLRGVAHAGAYEETGGGRFIFALDLQPTQLRIGAVISRGGVSRSSNSRVVPEIARIDGSNISVEPYQAKQVGLRSRT